MNTSSREIRDKAGVLAPSLPNYSAGQFGPLKSGLMRSEMIVSYVRLLRFRARLTEKE
jgi:hypothetical protein